MTILNKKMIYALINDALLSAYPEAKKPYAAVKMHLEALREELHDTNSRSLKYELIISEILYFEWYIKSDNVAILKQLEISSN